MRRLAAVVAVVAAMAVLGHVWAVPIQSSLGEGVVLVEAIGDPGADPPDLPEPVPERKVFPEIAVTGTTVEKSDVVLTRSGGRILGQVVSLDEKGPLKLVCREFDGEVRIAPASIDKVLLCPGGPEPALHEIEIAGGDRLAGVLKTITDKEVVLETKVAGTITVPLAVVRSIRLTQGSGVLLATDFRKGESGPWKTRSKPGTWTLGEDGLANHFVPNPDSDDEVSPPVYAPLDQKGAVTIVAKFKANEERAEGPHLRLVVFSNSTLPRGDSGGNEPLGTFGGACVMAAVTETQINLKIDRAVSGGVQDCEMPFDEPFLRSGSLRLAYDPTEAKARIWINDKETRPFEIQKPVPTDGKFVMIDADPTTQIEAVRVLRGIVQPGTDEEGPAAKVPEGKCLIQFANNDRVSASSIRMTDGQFEIATDHGDARSTLAMVSRIIFGAKDPKTAPQPAGGYAIVETGACRLTLRVTRLTADELVGQSDYLGEVKLQRSAVRKIDFNPPALEKQPVAPAHAKKQPLDPS